MLSRLIEQYKNRNNNSVLRTLLPFPSNSYKDYENLSCILLPFALMIEIPIEVNKRRVQTENRKSCALLSQI